MPDTDTPDPIEALTARVTTMEQAVERLVGVVEGIMGSIEVVYVDRG